MPSNINLSRTASLIALSFAFSNKKTKLILNVYLQWLYKDHVISEYNLWFVVEIEISLIVIN